VGHARHGGGRQRNSGGGDMTAPLSRLRGATARIAALALLPLSVVPIVAVVPGLIDGHRAFAHRFLDRGPVPAPAVTLSAAFAPRPPVTKAVPVLAYHGINDQDDGYSITPRAFAAQMAMLRRAGMHAITPEQYARWPGGSPRLPSRPILITFDDGRMDSYRQADRVLAREGLRATMFTITGPIDAENPFYLTWDELRRMQSSRRWDVQLHAADAHTNLPAGPKRNGAAYVNRRWADGELESFADYQRRVRDDLDRGMERLRAELGPIRADLFAIPYSADGAAQTNDRRIPAFLDAELHRRFAQVFVAGRPVSPPRGAQHVLRRYEVRSDTTPESLYAWLNTRPPTTAAQRARAARAQKQRSAKPKRSARRPSPTPSPSLDRIS